MRQAIYKIRSTSYADFVKSYILDIQENSQFNIPIKTGNFEHLQIANTFQGISGL